MRRQSPEASSTGAEGTPTAQVTEVVRLSDNTGLVSAHHLDSPLAGTASDTHALRVDGWALGTGVRIAAVEVVTENAELASIPTQVHRPDIARAFPAFDGPEWSGFSDAVGLLGVPRRFALEVHAVTACQQRVPIWRIMGERQTVTASVRRWGEPAPLLVNTLGRSGSKLLMKFLGAHPQVLAYRPDQLEPRPAGYWSSVLLDLASPASACHAAFAGKFSLPRWWAGDGLHGLTLEDRGLERWLGQDNVEAIADFCASRVFALYDVLCRSEGKGSVRYVAEKSPPARFSAVAAELMPGTRQIVLVRDFRDMLASALAFNSKRGLLEFGRERVNNDYEFVSEVRRNAETLLGSWREHSILVRYEDMVRTPVDAMADVYGQLGLDASLSTPEDIVTLGSWNEAAAEHGTSSGPTSSIGRWEREFSGEMKERAKAELGPVLEAFGYEPG